jgi:hypothetical protein
MVPEEAALNIAEGLFMGPEDVAIDRDMPVSIDEENISIDEENISIDEEDMSIDEEDMSIDIDDEEDMFIGIELQPKELVLSKVRVQMTRPSPLKRMLLAQRGAIESFVTDNRASIVSLVWWNQSFTMSTGALLSASMKA